MSGSHSTSNIQAAIPSSPIIVDAESGEVRVEWRAFFRRLWARTGGAQGAVTPQTPVSIAEGGTGAASGPQALVNLGAVPTTSDHVMVWG